MHAEDNSLIIVRDHTLSRTPRMWIFILLWILVVNISQATGQGSTNSGQPAQAQIQHRGGRVMLDEGNSTQMYYFKLKIDNNAINNVTALLKPFLSNNNLKVDELEKTTKCETVSAHTECRCEPGHMWSDKLCTSEQRCCRTEKCTFDKNPPSMCVRNTTVTVNGSITLEGNKYFGCLKDVTSAEYKDCNSQLLHEIKRVYSTLHGFDTFTITKYSSGSIIAAFEMSIAFPIKTRNLMYKTRFLSKNLSASVSLETAGVVHLSAPASPVCYHDDTNLICKVEEDLETKPVWKLKRDRSTFDITNGTQSNVISQTLTSEVVVRNASELWKGEYSCVYHQESEGIFVCHKAAAEVDISLLPTIHSYISPSFPRCKKNKDILRVEMICEIDESKEDYQVTWEKNDRIAVIKNVSSRGRDTIEMLVPCESLKPDLGCSCIFKNRCNQTRSAKETINVIDVHDQFCAAEKDWEDTKAGFEAVLNCKNAAGQRRRKCKKGDTEATWEKEVSDCVNHDLHKVLKDAHIVDIGLGSLDTNTARVISKLKDVTNGSQAINTFANVNASVQVFVILSGKEALQMNTSTADDFLKSSSNLLDGSLEESWKTDEGDQGNDSLAHRYLVSVESLIQRADIKSVDKKKNIDVAARNCSQESACITNVFNATIQLKGENHGTVKTAGFQELQKYLPQRGDSKPNSIVVSAVREKKQRQSTDSLEVTIKFQLLEQRPRNVKIQCVSWDTKNGRWSEDGCKWQGPNHEAECVCSHLSSFAILMSTNPLDLPGLDIITYVGLSTSIVSLVLVLLIELMVWNAVVKTNTLYLRHTAQINISLCLLMADICFLASSQPREMPVIWCKTFVVLKHFCFLAMFFWMLCLSCTLLHQTVYLFHSVSKKTYLKFSLVLGYICPLVIVVVTFLAYGAGAEKEYFTRETCWLSYSGLMKGSIHTFILPVGIIVFINMFAMVIVIIKLLSHPKDKDPSYSKERVAAVTVVRSVILLTPVFGITWFFGFFVMYLDLAIGRIAYVVNYAFTLLNAFQGFFILLTTCVADKLTREALLKRLCPSRSPASTTETSTKSESTLKK